MPLVGSPLVRRSQGHHGVGSLLMSPEAALDRFAVVGIDVGGRTGPDYGDSSPDRTSQRVSGAAHACRHAIARSWPGGKPSVRATFGDS
jgi:hypothetical protein